MTIHDSTSCRNIQRMRKLDNPYPVVSADPSRRNYCERPTEHRFIRVVMSPVYE